MDWKLLAQNLEATAKVVEKEHGKDPNDQIALLAVAVTMAVFGFAALFAGAVDATLKGEKIDVDSQV